MKLALMAVIMTVIVAVAAGVVLAIAYRAEVERQRDHLSEGARGYARLLESVGRAHMALGGDAFAETLAEVGEAYEGFGETGEYVLAQRKGDRIVFLPNRRFGPAPASIPIASALAEPMRNALAGRAGTVTGTDYRGKTVLAAHEPVGIFGLGVVAKIDVTEIRAPLIRAGLYTLGITVALIIIGCVLFLRIGRPLLRQLERSRAALSKTQTIAHLGSWSYRVSDQRIEWSDETYRIFGLEPQSKQITTELLATMVYPDDRKQLASRMERMNEARPGDRLSDVSYRVIRPDGSVRFVNVDAELEFGSDGRPLRAVGAIQDVTDRELAETILRQSEERFRSLFENAPVGVAIVDLKGRLLQANRALVQFLGYSSEELCRMKFAELTHPEHVEADIEMFEELVAGKRESYRLSKRYVRRDGRIVWGKLSASLVRQPSGEPMFLISMVEDIDEHRRISQALMESEERYRTIFNVSQSAFLIYDLDGTLVDLNAAACEMHGYSREEMLAMNGCDLIHEDTRKKFSAFIEAIRSGESSWQSLEKRRRKDGSTFSVVMQGRPYRDQGRTLALSTLMDVTALKQAEQDLRRLTQELDLHVKQRTAELQAANHELEAFSYSVSHDLRAPLRHVESYSRLALEDYGDLLDEKGQHFLRRIQAGAQEMTKLIDELLRLSCITRTEIKRCPVDLSRVARDVVRTLEDTSPERHVEFVIPSGIVADGDAGLLRVLLQNLLDNAWKFTRKNSNTACIEFGVETDDDAPSYFVRDNGAGFAMSQAHRLFRPFQRLHEVADFEGTGIGLATVKRIVEKHGGRVWAESETGKGTSLHFTLGEEKRSRAGA